MTTLKIKRGPSGNLAAVTPAQGELIYVTNTGVLKVGDGTTAGGANLSVNNATVANTALAVAGANVSGTVANANNSLFLGGVAANAYAQLSGAAFTGNVSGTNISVTGNANAAAVSVSGNVSASRLISTVAVGTAPFVVTSTTAVANLTANNATFAGTVTSGTQANISTLSNVNLELYNSATTGTATRYLLLTSTSDASGKLNTTAGITANAANSSITATTFVGALSGTATFANTANAVAGANVSGTVANANNSSYLGGTAAASYLLTTGTGSGLTAITGANVTGTVANANNSSYLGGVAANAYAQLSGATFTGNVSGTNISVTGNVNAASFYGNSVTASAGNALVLSGDSITYSNYVGTELDSTVRPILSSTGWYYGPGGGMDTVSGGTSTTPLQGYYFDGTTVSGNNVVTVSAVYTVETFSPVTFNATVAANLVGKYVACFNTAVSASRPTDTVFPAGAYITAADSVAGTVTLSQTALTSISTLNALAGYALYNASKNFYWVYAAYESALTTIGGAGAYLQVPVTTGLGSLPASGGPLPGRAPVLADFTASPSVTWTVDPVFLAPSAASARAWRSVDTNQTLTSGVGNQTRFNNTVVIGTGANGVPLGYNSDRSYPDSAGGSINHVNGLSVIQTGLDARTSYNGNRPQWGVYNFSHTDNLQSTSTTEANAERYGALMLNVLRNGNINTLSADAYPRQYRALGRYGWWSPMGTTASTGDNVTKLNLPAVITARAETDLSGTSFDVGMYLQYSPGTTGVSSATTGHARTFLRARQQETTLSGGDKIMFKPLTNYATTSQNRSQLNATQAQVWAQASYYTGGNATTEGSGSLFQARGDRSTGNVAIGINRATGTTASYELILKSGESALTLFDKTNTANIATFTNNDIRFNGNVASYGPVTVRPLGDGSTTARINLIQTSGTASNIQIAASGTMGAGLTFIVEGVEKAFFDQNDAKYLNSHLNVIRTEAAVDAKLKLQRQGGTAANFDLIVKQGENRLSIVDANATATIATFDTAKAAFTVPVQFPVYTVAGKPASGVVGQQIAISDSAQGSNPNGMMAFWDTSNGRWSYIHDNSAV